MRNWLETYLIPCRILVVLLLLASVGLLMFGVWGIIRYYCTNSEFEHV